MMATTTTVTADAVRCGDRLDDGTSVYDTAPSALTPGHVAIASAINGSSRCMVVPAEQPVEVTRSLQSNDL